MVALSIVLLCCFLATCRTQPAHQNEEDDEMIMLQLRTRNGHKEAVQSSEKTTCEEALSDVLMQTSNCVAPAFFRTMKIAFYVEEMHSVSKSDIAHRFERIVDSEALRRVLSRGQCTDEQLNTELGLDAEMLAVIHADAVKAAQRTVTELVEFLEDPETYAMAERGLGHQDLVEMYQEQAELLSKVCGADSSNSLLDEEAECLEHMNLDVFTDLVMSSDSHQQTQCGSGLVNAAFVQAKMERLPGEQQRAKLVHVLHTHANNLSENYMKHLKYGGSASNMDMLIRYELMKSNLTATQMARLKHLDASIAVRREAICADKPDVYAERNGILLNNAAYRNYMQCLCHTNELSMVCEMGLMQGSATILEDIKNHQHKQLMKIDTEASETTNQSLSAIRACVIGDAFSCLACLGAACVDFGKPKKGSGSSRRRGTKNSAWEEIRSHLKVRGAMTNGKKPRLSVSCTACAAVVGSMELVTFETTLKTNVELGDTESIFTTTDISVAATTCIHDRMRVAFDVLGLNVCQGGLTAVYKPFIGALDITGSITASHGASFTARFGHPIHEPTDAVKKHCRDSVGLAQMRSTLESAVPSDSHDNSEPSEPSNDQDDQSLPFGQDDFAPYDAKDDDDDDDDADDFVPFEDRDEDEDEDEDKDEDEDEDEEEEEDNMPFAGLEHYQSFPKDDSLLQDGQDAQSRPTGSDSNQPSQLSPGWIQMLGPEATGSQKSLARNLLGGLRQISVSGTGYVWGVDSSGHIYSRNGVSDTWHQEPGKKFVHVDVSGDQVWAVQQSGKVKYRLSVNGATTWIGVDGSLSQISVANDGSVWGVGKAGSIKEALLYRRGKLANWEFITHGVRYVSVAGDHSQYVWVVTNTGQARFRDGDGTWKDDTMNDWSNWKQLEVGDDGWVWGVNHDGIVYSRNGWTASQISDKTGQWKKVGSGLNHVSVGPYVWGVNSWYRIYTKANSGFAAADLVRQTYYPAGAYGGYSITAVAPTITRVSGHYDDCFKRFKDAAGTTMFAAAAVIPMLSTPADYEVVKISGPHPRGEEWEVKLFGLPGEAVAKAFKKFLEDVVAPALTEAGKAVEDGAEVVGEAVGEVASEGAKAASAVVSGTVEQVGRFGGSIGSIPSIGGDSRRRRRMRVFNFRRRSRRRVFKFGPYR